MKNLIMLAFILSCIITYLRETELHCVHLVVVSYTYSYKERLMNITYN